MKDAPIFIDPGKCRGCTKCVPACPFDALFMEGKLAVVRPEECRACNACIKACPFNAISAVVRAVTGGSDLDTFQDVWVFAEQRDGKVEEVAYELLATARRLARTRKCSVGAVLLGHQMEKCAAYLIAAGADKVYVVDQPELEKYDTDIYADALHQLISKYKPEVLLAGATAIGRSFFAKVAVRARTGLTADCTALSIDPETWLLHQTRPAFGGNIMATIMTPHHRPQMATVRQKVFKMEVLNPNRQGEILQEALQLATSRTRIVRSTRKIEHVNIAEAEIVVAGGRGLQKADNLEHLKRIAEMMGGVVGVSRACVDAGWISAAHQVGQTGKTISPKIYLAFGISGAIQHIEGIRSSDLIIAVNSDPQAPIFGVADLGVVGDLFEILPILEQALESKQEGQG